MDNVPTTPNILLILDFEQFVEFSIVLHCSLLSCGVFKRCVLCFRPRSARPNNCLLKVCVGKNIEKVSILAQYSNNILFCQMVN